MGIQQHIVPNLWFDCKAEEAVDFYTSIFEHTSIGARTYYGKEGQEIHGQPDGAVMTIDFQLENYKFVALNGGPYFKFNPSVSFFVTCDSEQKEEQLWEKLSEGGKILMLLDSYEWSPKYGWIQDKFGISWQLMLNTDQSEIQKICPLIFFSGAMRGKAEAALRFYCEVFNPSHIDGILHYKAH